MHQLHLVGCSSALGFAMDSFHQAAEDSPSTDFDERFRFLGQHLIHAFVPLDGRAYLFHQKATDLIEIVVGFGIDIGDDRNPGWFDGNRG